MASQIRVDVVRTLETSHAVSDEAERLRSELASLSSEWNSVLSGWSGAAASSYAVLWEEWHDGTVKLVEALTRSSEMLARAAIAYDEQESISSCSVRCV